MHRPLMLALTCLVGCGQSQPRLYPVSGKVFFRDGSSVLSAIIEFAPARGGPTARGKINADGTFTLKTGERDGAVADGHRIVIVQTWLSDGAPSHARRFRHANLVLAPKYRSFDTSPLERQVEPDKKNVFMIEVESDR